MVKVAWTRAYIHKKLANIKAKWKETRQIKVKKKNRSKIRRARRALRRTWKRIKIIVKWKRTRKWNKENERRSKKKTTNETSSLCHLLTDDDGFYFIFLLHFSICLGAFSIDIERRRKAFLESVSKRIVWK